MEMRAVIGIAPVAVFVLCYRKFASEILCYQKKSGGGRLWNTEY